MKREVLRRGATSLQRVPADVLARLETGEIETVNLMEWLRTDMSALALHLATEISFLADPLRSMAKGMCGLGVTGRLKIAGRALAPYVGSEVFERLSVHRSDIIRQWACYAVNDVSVTVAVADRLNGVKRFADDTNMSVREAAWMAFRPHLPADPTHLVALLLPLTLSSSENLRRFAIEVTRPRSVWGAHLPVFKRHPDLAADLINAVMSDESKYVRLAVGNWLNDAAKTRPDWVSGFCSRWERSDDKHTRFIVKRGSRTLLAQLNDPAKSRAALLNLGEAS